ncbi:MAG: gliding motility-associated ABC transporter substrate-binding protein GldG [Croceivirga sp.]
MKKITQLISGVLLLLLVNVVAHYFYHRFDLTEDKRFTLSSAAERTVEAFESPVIIDILLDGKLPSEFAVLQKETVLLLEQFRAKNKRIVYNLVNPLEEASTREQTIVDLQQLGLKAASVTVEDDGKTTQELLFPWAMVNYQNKTFKVPLLKNKLGASAEERINNSVQNLEYAFTDAFKKLQLTKKKKIAVLKGNGQLEDAYLADFLTSIKDYYNIGAMTIDSTENNPSEVLEQLSGFDMVLMAKPTDAFSENEKYVLDHYIVQGGNSLWLMDQVAIELDSLFNETGSNVATRRDLNLDDFFFRYGVRINPVLVNDLYNSPIVLANGEANESQYNPLPWVYNPMVFTKDNHPINTNIEALRLQFSNAIDTLENTNKKTVLLRSSPLSKLEGTPKRIGFDILNSSVDKKAYPPVTGYPLSVLIEGRFSSAYSNRIKPIDLPNEIEEGNANKMIVVADGDIIKNQLQKGRPLELGYDKWTNSFYGNKEFLVNCVNYLLDDNGFINIRSKTVRIPLLDAKKIVANKSLWQGLTIGLPVVLVILIGIVLRYLRKRKFAV